MRKLVNKIALATALAGVLALPPGAASASVIGTLGSWGINTAAINAADDVAAGNYATAAGQGFTYVTGDYVGPGGRVGPGIGGQRYDLEALYVRQSGSVLTVAGITGAAWDQRGQWDFGIGDLFIGQRGAGANSFTGYGVELTGAMYIMNSGGFTAGTMTNNYTGLGSLHRVTPGVGYGDGIASSRANDPLGLSAPGQLINQGMAIGDGYNDGTAETPATHLANNVAAISWEQFAGGRHSAFIAEIDLSLMLPTILNQWGGNVLLHWGEVCANDYLTINFNVPEPASVLLVFAGLLAMMILHRRQRLLPLRR